jgi:hypothetical protein
MLLTFEIDTYPSVIRLIYHDPPRKTTPRSLNHPGTRAMQQAIAMESASATSPVMFYSLPILELQQRFDTKVNAFHDPFNSLLRGQVSTYPAPAPAPLFPLDQRGGRKLDDIRPSAKR